MSSALAEETAAVQQDVHSAVRTLTHQMVSVGSDIESNVSAATQVITDQEAGLNHTLSTAVFALSHQNAMETTELQHGINSQFMGLARESVEEEAELQHNLNQSVEALAQQLLEDKLDLEHNISVGIQAVAHQAEQEHLESGTAVQALTRQSATQTELQRNLSDAIEAFAQQDLEQGSRMQHELELTYQMVSVGSDIQQALTRQSATQTELQRNLSDAIEAFA